MAKTIAFRKAELEILLNAVGLANIWTNATSSPATQLFLSLHEGDPGVNGDQTTNETTYGAYARLAFARDGTAWVVNATTGIATPTAIFTFATPTSGSGTISHVGIGRDSTGTGYLFRSGPVNPNIVITVGTPPQLTTSTQII